ncbi:Fic family protein [Gemmatimonadota bacterium]
MLTLDPGTIASITTPVGTSWLLGSCMEARGKQDLWLIQKPEVIEVLKEQAIIQSAESSNRIEGITVAPERLRPVMQGKVKPRDRSEEELLGYRQAMNWIFTRRRLVEIDPAVILKLHSFSQSATIGDAGEWKSRDNEIIEILPNGERKVRFIPTPARQTPDTMDALCGNYRTIRDEELLPPLLNIATFIFDLLCIHPFRDGNGRVSRLATTLVLESYGFIVPRFISLERLIEETRDDYYEVLERCSQGWHEGTNEIVPWWNYFLGTVRRAYREFEQKIEAMDSRPTKSDLIRQTISDLVEEFTLSDLVAQLPSVSPQLIKKVLGDLKAEGLVQLQGRGRGAAWRVIR